MHGRESSAGTDPVKKWHSCSVADSTSTSSVPSPCVWPGVSRVSGPHELSHSRGRGARSLKGSHLSGRGIHACMAPATDHAGTAMEFVLCFPHPGSSVHDRDASACVALPPGLCVCGQGVGCRAAPDHACLCGRGARICTVSADDRVCVARVRVGVARIIQSSDYEHYNQ